MTYFVGRIVGPALLGLLRLLSWLTGDGPLGRMHVRIVCWLIRRTGLFDDEWYSLTNPDDAGAGMDPVRHFVEYGDREGRWPMRMFDPQHYRIHSPTHCPKSLNSLLHYAWQGRYRGASTSIWFDAGWYLGNNRDVKFSRIDPLKHFVRFGWLEGRLPTENFDRPQFLRAMAGPGQLLSDSPFGKASDPEPPAQADWDALVPVNHEGPVAVDVIVPVYRGYAETLRCIYAALANPQRTAFELVVINDAGPDVRLNTALSELAERGLFRYLENNRNLGFVSTVNRGMRLHRGRDVVLLNADAEPFGDWLDRLRACAYRSERVASVTPLSNNATICSYPRFNQDNPQALELGGRDLDAIAARANAGVSVPAPTGVGFCLFIRRAALDAFGLFDEESFGLGYGEENDFCQRAIAGGWQNLIAADTYVWHWGSTSFAATRRHRIRHAMEVMAARYPKYHADVAAFITADPLAPARRRMDEARLVAAGRDRNILVITHTRGGGTERLISDVVESLRARERCIYILRASENGRVQLSVAGVAVMPNIPPVDTTSVDALMDVCRQLSVSEIHVHQLVDYPKGTIEALRALRGLCPTVALRIYVHDYHGICPRINLVGAAGVYCGEPGSDECNTCLARPQSGAFRVADITRWRRDMGGLYAAASEVIVPDEDVLARLARYYPTARFRLLPHEARVPWPPLAPRERAPGEPLRVVAIGAIGNLKGYNVLLACARDARERRLPISFAVMGYSRDDRTLRRVGVTLTGRYREEDAQRLLAELDADIIWLPSVWPETYSYTLSIATAQGLPVAAFDLGAIAARLRREDRGDMLMPLGWSSSAARVNSEFIHFHARLARHGKKGEVLRVEST